MLDDGYVVKRLAQHAVYFAYDAGTMRTNWITETAEA